MNSLVNYGSDDDYDDSSEEKQTDWRRTPSKEKQSTSQTPDTNYEEVQMDLSETVRADFSQQESNDSPKETRRSRDRDSRDRKDRHRKDGKSREKDDRHRREKDRKPKRSSSRERRRSRSPRRGHSRSRSRSRDRNSRKHSKRYDNRSRQSEKNDSPKVEKEEKGNSTNESDRFFMPGITGRFRDQIERRKQLWQKKDTDPKDGKNNGQSKKVWETTTFAQDTDGKVANKFKRLMGIKNTSEAGGSTDVLKKQEEMFSSMEQQYEVARTATHTMRGVGLGFGSYQR